MMPSIVSPGATLWARHGCKHLKEIVVRCIRAEQRGIFGYLGVKATYFEETIWCRRGSELG